MSPKISLLPADTYQSQIELTTRTTEQASLRASEDIVCNDTLNCQEGNDHYLVEKNELNGNLNYSFPVIAEEDFKEDLKPSDGEILDRKEKIIEVQCTAARPINPGWTYEMAAGVTSGKQLPRALDGLPPNIHAYVRAVGGDFDLTTWAVIGSIAQAARKHHILKIDDSATYTLASLYLIFSAPPGHGKSTTISNAYSPNYALESEMVERQLSKQQEYQVKITERHWRINDLQEEGRKNRNDKKSRRHLARHIARLSRQVNTLKKLASWTGHSIATDATQAGIRNELYQSLDGYLSLILGDGRQLGMELLENCKNSKIGGLVQILLNCFTGDSIRFIRGGGANRSIELPDSRLTVVVGLQTDLGARLFGSPGYAESGLSSRFLSFFFDELDEPHKVAEPDLVEAWHQAVAKVATPPEDGMPVQCGIDPEAVTDLRQCFHAFSNLAADNRTSPLRMGFWSRAGEQLQRLCLVRALMEPAGKRWPHVTVETVHCAKIFLAHAALHMERGIELSVQASVTDDEVESLRKAINREGGELRMIDLANHNLEKRQVERILSAYPKEFMKRNKRSKRGKGRPAHVVVMI